MFVSPAWHDRLETVQWRRWCELLLIGLILAYFAGSPAIFDLPLCPFYHLWGWACPTCGTTRSIWAILHGDLALAWGLNPIGFVAVVALLRRLAILGLPEARWAKAANNEVIGVLLLGAFFVLGYARMCRML
jgi:hypothetical protein